MDRSAVRHHETPSVAGGLLKYVCHQPLDAKRLGVPDPVSDDRVTASKALRR